jgi:quercetin dioxygenase-like cupin family protein
MSARVMLYRWDDLPLERVTDMVSRKDVAIGRSTLTQAYFKKGALVPRHALASDAIIYVLQGALRARVDESDVTVREGQVLTVPAAAHLQAEMLDDTFVMTFM